MANLLLIRDLCERKKMTIRELSQRIGRDESSIQSAIRRGSTNSTTIELIAKELGVSAGIFFDGFAADESVALRPSPPFTTKRTPATLALFQNSWGIPR